jgi:hypothetical protein
MNPSILCLSTYSHVTCTWNRLPVFWFRTQFAVLELRLSSQCCTCCNYLAKDAWARFAKVLQKTQVWFDVRQRCFSCYFWLSKFETSKVMLKHVHYKGSAVVYSLICADMVWCEGWQHLVWLWTVVATVHLSWHTRTGNLSMKTHFTRCVLSFCLTVCIFVEAES